MTASRGLRRCRLLPHLRAGDQRRPELVDKFQAAIAETLWYVQDNPDEVRRIVTTYPFTKINPLLATD